MKHLASKLVVTFVFLTLSMLPYVGYVFLALAVIWAIWALLLLIGLIHRLFKDGFAKTEAQYELK